MVLPNQHSDVHVMLTCLTCDVHVSSYVIIVHTIIVIMIIVIMIMIIVTITTIIITTITIIIIIILISVSVKKTLLQGRSTLGGLA